MKKLIRLSKLMSERGISSRREADSLIEKGLVLVDGKTVNQLGTKVEPNCDITLKNQGAKLLDQKLTVLLHKPVGYVSCQPEKGYSEALDLIKDENRDKFFKTDKKLPKKLIKFSVAGRLDINSKGLLVLTQDGQVAKKIIGENSHLEKEYLVRVSGKVTNDKIAKLCFGLKLDGKLLKRAKVTPLKENLLKFVLTEGKKRQIRRMCDLVDLSVSSIKRVRIGKVNLANLKAGCWRFLEDTESFD